MKKSFFITIFVLIIIILAFYYTDNLTIFFRQTESDLPRAVKYQKTDDNKEEQAVEKADSEEVITRADNTSESVAEIQPGSLNLDVPFTSQAPWADWQMPFKEACEEAAILMVHYYYQNKELNKDAATDEILAMVEWQAEKWSGHFDLTAASTTEMIKGYLGYKKVEIIDNPTIEQIKNLLNQKLPVIIPAAGRSLNNPYFKDPGPLYHMLVIKGYTEDKFITNEPGTKRGHNFLYDQTGLMEAIHDWQTNNILAGAKKAIVIYP